MNGKWPPEYKPVPRPTDADLRAWDNLCILCAVLLGVATALEALRGPVWLWFAGLAGYGLAGFAAWWAFWRARHGRD